MPKDILSKEIIEIFKKKTGWKLQTIRDNISRFKIKECPHSTQNAAAHILALTKGFSCKKRLKKEDISTIPFNINDITKRYNSKTKKERNVQDISKKFRRNINTAKDVLEREAWKNAEMYPNVYILENKLRNLILNQLGNNQSWWKVPEVPQDIITYAQNIQEDEKDVPWISPRGKHPIYYTTLRHLTKIIRANWPKFNRLGNQNKFFLRVDDLHPLRHGLAHNVPLSSRDKKELDISVDKICKIIKSKYNI